MSESQYTLSNVVQQLELLSKEMRAGFRAVATKTMVKNLERRLMGSIDNKVNQLAAITQAGFDQVDLRFVGVETRLDRVEGRLDGVENRLDRIELRQDQAAHRFEFQALERRVDVIEGQLKLN